MSRVLLRLPLLPLPKVLPSLGLINAVPEPLVSAKRVWESCLFSLASGRHISQVQISIMPSMSRIWKCHFNSR